MPTGADASSKPRDRHAALTVRGIDNRAVKKRRGVAIVIDASARNTVRDDLLEQKIVGAPDMTPTAIKAEAAKAGLNTSTLTIPSCSAAGKTVENGSSARCSSHG